MGMQDRSGGFSRRSIMAAAGSTAAAAMLGGARSTLAADDGEKASRLAPGVGWHETLGQVSVSSSPIGAARDPGRSRSAPQSARLSSTCHHLDSSMPAPSS